MKRLLFLTFALLLMAGTASAQSHWSYEYGQAQDEAYVYADLTLNGTMLQADTDYSNYEFAAFVDGVLAGVSTLEITPETKKAILKFRIEGDDTNGGEISFKVYNTATQMEYNLYYLGEAPWFDGETLFEPSSPLHLYLTEPETITLSDIEVNVDDVVDLTDYLTVDPVMGQLPNNLTWEIVDQGYFTIEGNTLTATAANTNGAWLRVVYGIDNSGEAPQEKASMAQVFIYQPATTLTQNATEVTVNLGDDEALLSFLDGCYTLEPEGTTDRLAWSVQSGTAVAINGKTYEPYTAAVGDAVLTGTVVYKENTVREGIDPIAVTVHVVQPVTSITTPFIGWSSETGTFPMIECNVGDDLTTYFVDGMAFSVLPAEATNKAVTFEYSELVNEHHLNISADGKITAESLGGDIVKVVSADNPSISCDVYVMIYNDYQTITASPNVLNVLYTNETVDITEQVMACFQYGPEGATTGVFNIEPETSDASVVGFTDEGIFAYSPGTAVITMWLTVKDRLKNTFDPNGNNTTNKSAELTVNVSQGLTGITVTWPTDLATGHTSTLTIKPVPDGASFEENLDFFQVYGNDANDIGLWMIDVTDKQFDENGNVVCQISCIMPGQLTLIASYNDGAEGLTYTSETMEIGYTYTMADGWSWQAIPYGYPENVETGLETIFGDNLVEIRTQDSQLYNDPEYGYFGSQDLLTQGVCFKVKMQMAEPADERTYDFYGGSLANAIQNTSLRAKWNYLPNPLFFDASLTEAFSETMTFVDGDRIVSKEDGFAEYNGGWEGTLTSLTPGEGYMFYNAGTAQRDLQFVNQFGFGQEVVTPGGGESRMKTARRESVWQYDARRFRDNMSIVATIEGMASVDHCSVGAFVGDECRGEGRAVNGKMFITVHADAGEQISFRLRDELTGQLFDIDQQVMMQQMLGTVKQPLKLSSANVTTGISQTDDRSLNADHAAYDLGGRQVMTGAKGVTLQRQSDGTVRKVVRK